MTDPGVAPIAPAEAPSTSAPRPIGRPYPEPIPGASWLRRRIDYLRAHPVLVLLLFSPGLPEYVSGSSPLNAIAWNPGWFLLQLGLNLGLYGPGVLLIREAAVRWRTGLVPVLLLGAAYGILEEGVALSTLFNPAASVVGGLGTYGHFDGVNTVWLPGVIMVHMVYSIGLPIFLLDRAVPETRGRPLLSARGRWLAAGTLAADVGVLLLAIVRGAHFWMGWPLFVGSFAAIALLVLAAARWPAGWLRNDRSAPSALGVRGAAVLGSALFTGVLLTQAFSESEGISPVGAIVGGLAVQLTVGYLALRWVAGPGRERLQLGFAIGLLAPIMVFGLLSQFPLVFVALADAALLFWFSRQLRGAPAPYQAPASRFGPAAG